MRIWHKQLIPKLCRQHLLSLWREGLGMYSIIINGKEGYRQHPATQEYIETPETLYDRLSEIRVEMLSRNYKPKELPQKVSFGGKYKEWQTLQQQIGRLIEKGCECRV